MPRIDTWSLAETVGPADRSMVATMFAEYRIDMGLSPMVCAECGSAYASTTYVLVDGGTASAVVCTNPECINN